MSRFQRRYTYFTYEVYLLWLMKYIFSEKLVVLPYELVVLPYEKEHFMHLEQILPVRLEFFLEWHGLRFRVFCVFRGQQMSRSSL